MGRGVGPAIGYRQLEGERFVEPKPLPALLDLGLRTGLVHEAKCRHQIDHSGRLANVARHRVRRTLGGAMVTLSGTKLTVERAPPRRTGAKTAKHRVKTAFTKRR